MDAGRAAVLPRQPPERGSGRHRLYFSGAADDEPEIRDLAAFLYERIDWSWATAGGSVVRMGWKPEAGFQSYHWEGYSEAMLLYILGLGSPTHPLPAKNYVAWAGTCHPSFDVGDGAHRGWLSLEHHGLDQGPVALMIENCRSGLIWRLMRECPVIVTGLRRAGFRGGWLRSSAR